MRRLCLIFCLLGAAEARAGKPPRALPTIAAQHIPIPTPDKPVAELVNELSTADAPTRDRITRQLAGAQTLDKKTTDDLVAALDGADGATRDVAAWVLGHRGMSDGDGTALYDGFPKLLEAKSPQYPMGAFQKGISGTVLVEVVIGVSGDVTYEEVRESIPGLDAAALACVKQWKFEPAKRHGKPCPMLATAPVAFRLV
jgi:protein TonB